jgi:predicted NBD/HSP70 family sugar kinase
MGEKAYIGLDIGGQSIKGLRLEGDGLPSVRSSIPTPAGGAAAVLSAVRACLAELGALGGEPGGSLVASVGAGTPGGVDAEGRIVGEAANIPGWPGTALGAAVAEASGVPASVRNDGNLAAYAEWAARGGSSRAFLFVGLGTGIGAGYVEDGRILSGVNDKALEIGHYVVYPNGRKCACGRSGCAEAYASGPSIGRIASELAPRYGSPLARAILSGAAGSSAAINAREVYEALAKGDELAREADRVAAEALSRVIGAALAVLAPDTVCLGGGVLAGASGLVEEVAALAPSFAYPAASEGVRFEAARLGPEAGLLGAALYGASRVLGGEELKRLSARAAAAFARP